MRKIRNGFTLIELVLVLGIITIISAGAFMSVQANANRALENASLALQADIRYVQRRSITEGQRYRIIFDLEGNCYRIYLVGPNSSSHEVIRTVYLRNGVFLCSTNLLASQGLLPRIEFLPRGTLSPQGGRVWLSNGRYTQTIYVLQTTGRVRIADIAPVN